jgi:hypothetical protein
MREAGKERYRWWRSRIREGERYSRKLELINTSRTRASATWSGAGNGGRGSEKDTLGKRLSSSSKSGQSGSEVRSCTSCTAYHFPLGSTTVVYLP